MKLSKSYFALIISSLFVLNSCGILSETSGKSESTDQSPGSGSVLSDILNTVMGKAPLTYKNMAGTWDYKKSAVAFETDNLLKKAGVDMSSPEPIKLTIQRFEHMLGELEKLLQE